MDPHAVVQIQRLDAVAMLIYRGPGRRVDADDCVYGEGDASDARLLSFASLRAGWEVGPGGG